MNGDELMKKFNCVAQGVIGEILASAKEGDRMCEILIGSFYEIGKKVNSFIGENCTLEQLLRTIQNSMYQVANDINNQIEQAKEND